MRVIQVALVIVGIIFTGPVGSCPSISFSDYLTGLPDGVLVSYDDGNIIFDDSGNFRQEFSIDPSRIIGMSKDGRFWSFQTKPGQTIISSHTNNGSIIREYELKGLWRLYIQGDILFVGRDENSQKLQIDTLNLQEETLEHYATVIASSQIDRWAVGRNLICTVGWFDPASVVTCFSQDGTQQWTHEYYGVVEMYAYVQIDSQENVYLIGSLNENGRPAILQFDRYGNLKKEIPGKNGINGFAISESGSFFLADNDKVVHRYDSNGRLQESWDAARLVGNETWLERRNKERTADAVTEFSNTDDLIVATLNGKPAQRIKATNWLFSRGPEIIPHIIEHYINGSGFTEELLDRAMKEMPEESISEMARRFPKATQLEKEEFASKLIDAGRIDVPRLFEFLENKIQNTEGYDRFDFETLIVKMGKGRSVLEEKWRRFQINELEVEDLTFILSNNPSDASEILESSLVNSSDPWNPNARKLMSDAVTWSLNDKNSFKPSDIEKFEKWIRTGNPDLIPIATVCSLKSGNLQKWNDAIQFAKDDLSLAPAVLKISTDVMKKNPELKSGVGSQIFDLAKRLLFSEGDEIQKYFAQDVLKEFMFFSEFRDMAVSDALQSFASTTTNSEFIISNYLGPELVSSGVVSGFLAIPVSSNEKYWQYVDLIATRYSLDPFIKQQLRTLMLSQINRDSPYASNALKILAKIGALSDSEIISNLVRHGSLSRAAFPTSLQTLLDEAGKTSGYHPIVLTGSMFVPYGKEAEDGLLSKLETVNDRGRQEILLLLAEIGSKVGYEIVRKEFDDSLKEEQFPPNSSIAALIISGEDPWSELMEGLSEIGDGCDEYLLRSFPSRVRIQAATRIAQLMLNENEVARFKVLRCWLYKMDYDDEIEYLLEWVRLNHPNPKMREFMLNY